MKNILSTQIFSTQLTMMFLALTLVLVSSIASSFADGVPTVTSVSSTTTNGSYSSGTIDVTVNFNDTVVVTGNPRIQLETGTTDQYATYTNGNGTSALHFTYTIQSGDTTGDLDYKATDSLGLNAGTIKSTTSNDATLTLVAPGAAGSLGANKDIVIDTTAPTISSVTPASSSTIGSGFSANYTLSETVASGSINFTRTGGSTDGAIHIYNFGNGDKTSGSHSVSRATLEAGFGNSLVNGAIYIVTISATDAASNTATPIINTSITYDTTVPTITPVISGTLGDNGWYTSNVSVSWTVLDNESPISSQSGCGLTNIITDTTGMTLTCTATSTGGTSSQSVTIKRDATAPTITAPSEIILISSVSVSPSLGVPIVNDNLDASPNVTNNAPTSFAPDTTTTVIWTVKDHAGNTANASQLVVIQTPGQAVNNLVTKAKIYGANTSVLGNAPKLLNDGNTSNDNGACGKLTAFINQLNASKKLDQITKSELIATANVIRSSIGC